MKQLFMIDPTRFNINSLWHGFSQIMLQENRITGILFLVGISYGSVSMGIAALAATLIATLTAHYLKYDLSKINQGLYGFSAALVGVAMMLFIKPLLLTTFFVVVGAVLAPVLQHFFIKRNIPAFTFPFVLITWLVYYFTQISFPECINHTLATETEYIPILNYILNGFGQVILQGNWVSGFLFFVAVLLSSYWAAIFGAVAACFSAFLFVLMSASHDSLQMGLFSFNAVLCAITFSGKNLRAFLWSFLAVFLSVLIEWVFWKWQILPLTFPFVAASFITTKIKHKSHNFNKLTSNF